MSDTERDEENSADKSREKFVAVFKAANTDQALILKNYLESEDIEASVVNEAVEQLLGFESSGASSPAIMVRESDVERAQQLASELEKRVKESVDSGEYTRQMLAEPMLEWNKEKCLVCKQPRAAICPGCEISGTDFDPAEFEQFDGSGGVDSESEEDDVAVGIDEHELRLMCSVCDKSFAPQYVRYCTKCGNDYGDGVDVAPVEVADDPVSDKRVIVIVASMLIVLLAAAIWFGFMAGGQ